VEVREQFDGQIEIIFNGRRLKYRDITDKTKREKPKSQKAPYTGPKGIYPSCQSPVAKIES